MRPRILNLEPEGYNIDALKILTSFSDVDKGPLTQDELLENISQYDGLIVRLGHRIDENVLDAASRLKVISTATTGLNHINCEYAKRIGISIISLQGEATFLDTIQATAEHTWALLLALIRNIPASVRAVDSQHWNRDAFKGSELHGKTLGIIGYGRLGRKVSGYGKAFGMTVIVTDIRSEIINKELEFVSLTDLLIRADIVTVHIPYNSSTDTLLGRNEFRSMKPGSFFINTSRGEVIDEGALLDSLHQGLLGGAALDVMRGENKNDKKWMLKDPLIQYAKTHRNLIITPHLGGCTYESMAKTEIFIAKKMKDFFHKKSSA